MEKYWKKSLALFLAGLMLAEAALAGTAAIADAKTVTSEGVWGNVVTVTGKHTIKKQLRDYTHLVNNGKLTVNVRGGLKLLMYDMSDSSTLTLKMASEKDVFSAMPNGFEACGTLIVEFAKGYVPKKKIKIMDGYCEGKFRKVIVKGSKLQNPTITYSGYMDSSDFGIYLEGEVKNGVYKRNSDTYKITELSGKKAGKVVQTKINPSYAKKQYTMKNSISLNGNRYQVTKVGDKAFQKTGEADTVVIGKNVREIGKNVFGKSVKKVVVKSAKLKAGSVSRNAFGKNNKVKTLLVPKKKLSEYKKLFRECGLSASVKIKAQ